MRLRRRYSMMNKIAPKVEFFEEYKQWLKRDRKSDRTIEEYSYIIESIEKALSEGKTLDEYFSEAVAGKILKVSAFRSYLSFLEAKKIISRIEKMDGRDRFKPPIKRSNYSDRKWSIPEKEWGKYIQNSRGKMSRMGLWVGFNFGLRLNEIIHLRLQDLNFEKKEITIQEHKKTLKQEKWNPKFNRKRSLPLSDSQCETFKRWIKERPKELQHNYLLWTPSRVNKGKMLNQRNFQRMCSKVGLHPHVLRYSFATHYYNKSKNIKLISIFLGHANASTTSGYLQLDRKEAMEEGRALFSK